VGVLVQVVTVPASGGFGFPSQTTLGLFFPPRVMVYPLASVETVIVGPSYLSVDRSIFQEPFHGFSCPILGTVRERKHAKAQIHVP
jgi:hypothetical protein